MARLFCVLLIIASSTLMSGCSGAESTLLPGKLNDGRVRLPNGWILSPAGRQVGVGDLPLNLDVSPDGKYVIVTNNGAGPQSISVIETASWKMVQSVPVSASWLGIKFIDGGSRFLVSCGNDNQIKIYDFENGRAKLADSIMFGQPWPKQKIWIGGLDFDDSTRRLYVTARQADSLYVVNLSTKQIIKRLPLPAKPYSVLVSRDRKFFFVSLWGGSSVAVLDSNTLEMIATIPVGDHPNDMAETPDGRRLFVANANQNTVSVIDLDKRKVVETISTALTPNAPAGSTPNSVAIGGDGTRLYIANADNNYVTVVDITKEGKSRPVGFVPAGWYPTCVRVLNSTNQIIVANGKGGSSKANPNGPNPEKAGRNDQYIGYILKGALSLIDSPTAEQLQAFSSQVYANSPSGKKNEGHVETSESNPIPRKPGDASPIKHVFYIIKENRTYDQVFGDLKVGNGDARLCLFPEKVTPNHHALAQEFVLLDNFYADAEVSADGHNWSMAAYATDYVEKSWPTLYGGRGGEYEFEGGYPIAYPSEGYIWDFCRRSGVSYRSYGEFVRNGKTPEDSVTASVPTLVGHVAPFYRGWDLDYSDVDRVKAWMKEFDAFERDGNLPQFQVLRLPNDHTAGTAKGKLTPRAYVAQNDLALGMIVERISHSKYWTESAIFVIEDDAQNGPDHVDAHRTVVLVISPYAKRRFVDSELYSTSSMLRTIELVLGLPPMSQFDAAATPMYTSFSNSPDVTPFQHREAPVDLHEVNLAGVHGQQRSEEMDFSREDATPDVELNEIIWKSVRGPDSQMPAAVRSAFVRIVKEEK